MSQQFYPPPAWDVELEGGPAPGSRHRTSLLSRLRIHQDRDRPIVHQFHLHVRPKFTGLRRPPELLAQPADERLIKRDRRLWSRRTDIRRAIPLLGAREQRELAHQQNFSRRLLD